MKRLPIVGVMGSGDVADERAPALGRELAKLGVHLLTGGGGGVMTAVSRGFAEAPGRLGLVLGVLPGVGEPPEPKAGYPNDWVEVPIRTHLPLSGEQGEDPLSRNHVNVLSASVVVILPGGPGTRSEAVLAVRYRRPAIAFLANRDEAPGLPAEIPIAADLETVVRFVKRELAERGSLV